jgi:molecular chaperone DnaK (HSP70)
MGTIIGIDFGNTKCVTTIVEEGQQKVLNNMENTPETPSVVGIRKRKCGNGEAEIICGSAAAINWPMAPKDTICSIRQLMGRSITTME